MCRTINKHNTLTRSERGIRSGLGAGVRGQPSPSNTAVSADISLSRLEHCITEIAGLKSRSGWRETGHRRRRLSTTPRLQSAFVPIMWRAGKAGRWRSPARLHTCHSCLKTFNYWLFAGAVKEKKGQQRKKTIVYKPQRGGDRDSRKESTQRQQEEFDLLREPFSLNLPPNVLTPLSV